MVLGKSASPSIKTPKKIRQDVKVLSKKIKNKRTPNKLKTPDGKRKKNIGQIFAKTKVFDKAWQKTIHDLSHQNILSPVHLELLQKLDGQTVPRKRQSSFVKWVTLNLKLKKDKYLPVIEELYTLLKEHSNAEVDKVSAEKNLGIEHKSRRQKLREKRLKQKLKKKMKGEDEGAMEVALKEETARTEFVVPKKTAKKHKKKHLRELLKEKKERKQQALAGGSEMEVDESEPKLKKSSKKNRIKFESAVEETNSTETFEDVEMDTSVLKSPKKEQNSMEEETFTTPKKKNKKHKKERMS